MPQKTRTRRPWIFDHQSTTRSCGSVQKQSNSSLFLHTAPCFFALKSMCGSNLWTPDRSGVLRERQFRATSYCTTHTHGDPISHSTTAVSVHHMTSEADCCELGTCLNIIKHPCAKCKICFTHRIDAAVYGFCWFLT